MRASLYLGLARLRSDVPSAAALGLLVALTALVLVASQRWFASMSDAALRATVATANPFERNVEITSAARIEAERSDVLGRVDTRGAELQRELGEEVRELVRDRTVGMETPRHLVVNPPGDPGPAGTVRYLTPRFLAGASRHLRLVEGRLPARAGVVDSPFRGEQERAQVVELAVSRETARLMTLEPGDTLFLAPDSQDPLARAVPLSEHDFFAVRVVGVLEPRDPADPVWSAENRLRRPAVQETETARLVFAQGLFAREAYADLLAATFPLSFRYTWRYEVDPSALSADEIAALTDDVRGLRARFGTGAASVQGATVLRTGLFGVIERYERGRDSAAAVLALGGLGLVTVLLTVLGLLAALGRGRRARTIELARSRGASVPQVLGAQAAEALVVALPAAALGYVVALLAIDGRGVLPGALLALAVALGAGAVVTAAAVPPARRLGAREREDVVVAHPSPRRLALEGLVVLLAALGIYLLRRRGFSGEGGFDPYLAAVPVLVGLAAGILAFRLYPLPLAGVAWLAARRRDLVPALGFARAARQPSVGGVPLLAVLVALAVAVFGAALAETVAGGAPQSPFRDETLRALRIGVAVVGAYAVLSVVLSTVLTARSRGRDVAFLRTLGLSRRQSVGLVAVELGPPLALALVAGVALGIAVAYLVRPGLELGALAGAAGDEIAVDPVTTALLGLGLLVVSVAALTLAGLGARRVSLGRVLSGEER